MLVTIQAKNKLKKTYHQLLAKINGRTLKGVRNNEGVTFHIQDPYNDALVAALQLHKSDEFTNCGVYNQYLYETIQTKEKGLK
jgi:hypothetical protein